ncbi:MAG: maltotransferase domain-containing protein [Candidatus Nanopelagicales bacterium]
MIGRFPIIDISPVVEGGRYPVKAVSGEAFDVRATAFREGHDHLGVEVQFVPPGFGAPDFEIGEPDGPLVRLREVGPTEPDRWTASVRLETEGDWAYHLISWGDPYGTWLHKAEIKLPAGIDVELELEEGARVLDRASTQAADEHARRVLREAAAAMRETQETAEQRLYAAHAPAVVAALESNPLREHPTRSGPWPVRVERRRALYGAWYEFFPRSEGASLDPPRSGTFQTAAKRLPAVAAMGFDVVYLPPIHPIGHTFRKGPNNTLTPGPDDPGSPWAIGSQDGGHDAIHPDLGTMADFEAFMAAAAENGLEVALDFALQAAPDHPWVTAHPNWFVTRADGSIAYAENPPKKYQDIYPIYFDDDFDGLVAECERILRLWMGKGVRIFRVDNPHTKPVEFWEVLFARIYATDPDVVFLAEAFTLPAMMRILGTVGFQQSYTYFTWRDTKFELETYFTELSTFAADYMRPNCFVNTPDINPFFLQSGNRAAFAIRATLAALLAPSYGVYAGFELYEHQALAPGKEEYLNSEKFQYRPRDWAAASHTSLAPYLTMLNGIRAEHPAFHELRNLRFETIDNPQLIAFSKRTDDEVVVVTCVLDPNSPQAGTLHLDLAALGFGHDERVLARDLITGQTWAWGSHNYIRLDPDFTCAHAVVLERMP